MIRLKKNIILFVSLLLPLSVIYADECSALKNEAEKIKCYETKSEDVQRKGKTDQGDKLESDKKQAEAGDMEAQYVMGQRYYFGKGVEQDIHKAIEWWQKAAEQGHLQAKKDLAIWSGFLDGGADKWLKGAAEQGDFESKYKLALNRYLGGDYSEVPELLTEAEKGASCKDISMQKWQKVATAWQVNVKLLLGFIYFEGSGVSKDYNKSNEWFMKALECENSYEGTGLLYHLKKVRSVNFADFIRWLEDEEKNGSQESIKIIKYLNGKGLIENKRGR